MTTFTRHSLPADITVFQGDFASQPLVFAHLLDVAPKLDLDHVEVIQSNHAARLRAYFGTDVVANLPASDTLVLILPSAYDGLTCPLAQTAHLSPCGIHRGAIPHMVQAT